MREILERFRTQGQVLDVHAEIDPVHEAAAVVAEVQVSGNQVVVFHRVRGASMPVVANLYGSRHRLQDMLRAAPDVSASATLNAYIERSHGTVGDAATRPATTHDAWSPTRLSDLPLLTYHEEDAGAYITTGIILVRDPDTGVPNLSFHRALRVSDTELRISIGPRHDLGVMQARAEARGQALEVAMLVGVSPALFIAACTSLPPDGDEIALAACIQGSPILTRRSTHFGMEIPVDADVVIEGRILPNVRRPEAPFGEWMGYYMPEKQSHVVEVTHVERRQDAMFHALICGSHDDLRPLELTTAARIYKALSAQFSGVIDVACHPTMLCTVVKLRQAHEGQARQVLMATVTAHFLYSKMCIVVDEDVDIHDMEDVLWAYLTRGRPDQRTILLGDLPGFYRDPHKDHWGRIALDATKPWGREEEYRRKRIPGRNKVDLAHLLAIQPEV